MSNKLLTSEQVKKLTKNPYVKSATKRAVVYTSEFRQLAYDELLKGKTIRQIFSEAGFDTEALGEIRIRGFQERLEKMVDRTEGFADLRKNNRRQEPKSNEAQLSKKIKQLEHRLAYLEQENDFLKKLQEAERAEAEKCRRK